MENLPQLSSCNNCIIEVLTSYSDYQGSRGDLELTSEHRSHHGVVVKFRKSGLGKKEGNTISFEPDVDIRRKLVIKSSRTLRYLRTSTRWYSPLKTTNCANSSLSEKNLDSWVLLPAQLPSIYPLQTLTTAVN